MAVQILAAIPALLGKAGAVAAKGAAVAAKGAATAAKASAKAAASAAKASAKGAAKAGQGMGRSLGKIGKGLKPKLKTTKVKSFAKKKIKSKVKDRLKDKARDKSKKKLGKREKDTEDDRKLKKKSKIDSFNEEEGGVEKSDQVQGQEATTNLTQPQNVVEKIKPADIRLPPIQQLKINSTNIKNFLVSQSKKRAEAKKLNDRNTKKEESQDQFKREERKLEFSPFGGSKIKDSIPKASGGNIFEKLFEFFGLILLGIFVNALPAIIESVKGIINSVVDFITPIMSGFNLVKDFFTGEVDRKGSDADKKRVDDALKGFEEDGGLIDQMAEKLGPLGAIVKMLKPVVGMFRKQAGGKNIVKAKKGGKEGFLNKETGEFTPKQWTSAEREDYDQTRSSSGDGGISGGDDSTSSTSEHGGSVTAAGTGGISGFPINSDYGPRTHPVTGEPGKLHGGIDIGTPTGTAVAIDKPGKVLASGLYGGYGNMIDAWVPALKVQFRFAHLVKRYKKAGDSFKANEVLGETGGGLNDPGRGSSTGPHLHYEIDTTYNGTTYGGARNKSLLHEMSKHLKLGTVSATTKGEGGQFSKKDPMNDMDAIAKLSDTPSENESHNIIIQPYRTIQNQIVYM